MRERLGKVFVKKLLAPVVGGVHAANPDLLEMEALVPGLLAAAKESGSLVGAVKIFRAKSSRPGSAVMGLRKGIFTLIDALERDLRTRGVAIDLGAEVKSVVRIESGWLVEVHGGGVIKASSLVLALPAHRAANIMKSEPTLCLPLSRLVTADVALVLMVVRSAQLNLAPLGSGILIAPGSLDVLAKASTHATAKWGELQEIFGADIHLLRFSYGRDGVLPEDMENLPAQALRDAEKIYGVQDMELLESKVVNWPKSLIHAQAGHLASIKEMREALAHFENLTIVGAGLGGNGITGVIQQTRESVAGLQVA